MENIIHTLKIDIAYQDEMEQTSNFLELLQEISEVFKLQIVGLIPVGPGGAWPEITFRGELNNLKSFSRWFHDSEEDGDEYVDDFAVEDSNKSPIIIIIDKRYSTIGNRKHVPNEIEFARELRNISSEYNSLTLKEFKEYINEYTNDPATFGIDTDSIYYHALLWAKNDIGESFLMMQQV